jgi:hypothetical protein
MQFGWSGSCLHHRIRNTVTTATPKQQKSWIPAKLVRDSVLTHRAQRFAREWRKAGRDAGWPMAHVDRLFDGFAAGILIVGRIAE